MAYKERKDWIMLSNEKVTVNVWETFTNQSQWKEYLQNLLKTDNQALVKALILIYDLQTDEEKQSNQSISNNKMGFSKVDAKVLSDIARKFQKERRISLKDLRTVRSKMPKYWKQLMVISKNKIKEKKDLEDKAQEVAKINNEKLDVNKTIARVKQFREINEDMIKCSEENIPCDYGICSECILRLNYQLKLNL